MPIRPLLRHTLAVLAGTVLLSGLASANERPADWAQPVDPSFNLYRLSPTLYRSALPDSDDLPLLRRLGLNSTLSLIKDDDHEWAGDALTTRNFPTHADRVDDADVIRVLNMLQSAQLQGPVLLHCKHGRDRTGLFIAMYRSVIQGWSKDEALQEMINGGFGGTPESLEDAIRYVSDADVDAIRQAMREGRCSTSMLSFCQLRELAGEVAQYLFVPAQEDTLLAEDELQKKEGNRG